MKKLPACIALMLAYAIVGKLGLLLAVPPGYATAVFLPAGIAVAAMLLGGIATLPWTFLGSLLLNAWEGYALAHQLDALRVAVAVVIATGSALQAWVAGAVLRHALGRPVTLDNGRDLGRFLLLPPLCCLVSASFSLGGMWLLGAVSAVEFASSWITWWIGDTMGVLVAVPLMLVLAGEPRALWRGRTFTVAVPMVLLFALFVTIYARVSEWEYNQSLLAFRLLSQQAADRIAAGLDEQAAFLDQLERSFIGSEPMSRQHFRRLVEALPRHFPIIQAVEWAPLVTATQRPAFEAAQRAANPNWSITERNSAGVMQPAAPRKQFYPVTYIEPLAGNREAIGFDLASEPARRAAVETTIATGSVVATAPVRLVQEQGAQSGVLLVRAVGDNGNRTGVILTVLRMGDFVNALVGDSHSSIRVRLVDRDSGAALVDELAHAPRAAGFVRSFAFGFRHYRLSTAPTAAYLAAHRTWESWSVLVAGVTSTGLLGALLMLGTGQKHRFEQLVTKRTRELEASHDRVRREFAERQQAEAALRQAQKMEAVGQLTGGIAHDFNNLLTVIIGNLDRLRPHVSDEAGRRIIDMAERGADRGARLVQSLLAFSRRQMLRPEVVDVNRVIAEFEPLMQQGATSLVTLNCRFGAGLGPCRIDTAQFQSALLNLVTNARDAMTGPGGIIIIETAEVTIVEGAEASAPGGRYIVVTVTDTGAGMSEAVAARAFEPFYTTKEVGSGSGLGLSQVYGFAQQSGGFVQLLSTEGVGTSVRLYLPQAAPADRTARVHYEMPPPRRARTSESVLIVDDDGSVLTTTAEMVGSLGYHVLTAKDGTQALALIDGGMPVDLLFSDYAMSDGLTGDILARQARERRPDLKVLLVSGLPLMPSGDSPGAFPMLRKPYRQRDLAHAIRAALDG